MGAPSTSRDVRALRLGGQPCGCDPKANGICEGHARHVDESETEIEGAYQVEAHGGRQELLAVVSGPDREGDFYIMGAGGTVTYLPRFVCQDLVDELARRLKERAITP